jgi:hypothetical protein
VSVYTCIICPIARGEIKQYIELVALEPQLTYTLECTVLYRYADTEYFYSDCIGDSVIAGDLRWGGSYGVNVDYVARRYH